MLILSLRNSLKDNYFAVINLITHYQLITEMKTIVITVIAISLLLSVNYYVNDYITCKLLPQIHRFLLSFGLCEQNTKSKLIIAFLTFT